MLPFPVKRGFSLVEILFVITILVILVAITTAGFSAFRDSVTLNSEAENIVSVLSQARTKTLASEGGSQFGVRFDDTNNQLELFSGSSYGTVVATILLSTQVELLPPTLTGGGNDVIFNRLTGTTANDGSVVIRLVSDTSKVRTISISPLGSFSF